MDDNSFILVHCKDVSFWVVESELVIWSSKFLRLPIFHEATNCTDNRACGYLKNFAKNSYCFYQLPLDVASWLAFYIKIEIQAFTIAKEKIAPPTGASTAEELKAVKVLYILIEAESESKLTG